jgi:hypothetical protein
MPDTVMEASLRLNVLPSLSAVLPPCSGAVGGRDLALAFRQIAIICDKLILNRVFRDRACENYKTVRALWV